MAWGWVAAAVVTVVGGAIEGDKDRKAKNAANRERMTEEERKRAEWEELYGDLEQNVADYYKSLDPDELIAEGLQDEAESFAKASEQITTRLAQRNIQGSGLEADLIAKQEVISAEKRADIRATAEEDVIRQQERYVAGGRQEKQDMDQYRQERLDKRAEQKEKAWEETEEAQKQSVMEIVGSGMKSYGSKA